MELDIKIVVLVALCAAMVQGRDSDPGQSRRELLMKALNDLRSVRYGAMDRARDHGARGYGPPPQPMMKRYPAGPPDVNKAGRDYPPYNPYYKRFPDGQPDNAVPDTTGEPETESMETTTVGYEEEDTDILEKTLANLQEDLADIESMVVEMMMNIMKEKCGASLPDRAPYDTDVTSQDGAGPKFGQLRPVVDNNVAAAQNAIALSYQIAVLLEQIKNCMGVNGNGEYNGEAPDTNEGQVVETTKRPIVQTTESTEETTDELSDGDMEQLKRLLMKKLLEERVSALAKKGYPAGK